MGKIKDQKLSSIKARDLGAMFRSAREAKGITQLELAQMMGFVSAQYISNIERGLSFPPKHLLRQYCETIGAKMALILLKMENCEYSRVRVKYEELKQAAKKK